MDESMFVQQLEVVRQHTAALQKYLTALPLLPNQLPDNTFEALYVALEDLQKQGQELQQRSLLFADITLKIRQSLQLEEILQTTVTEVRSLLQAERVLIYRIWPDGTGSVVTESVTDNWPSLLGQSFSSEVFPVSHHKMYCEGKVRSIEDVTAADITPCHAEFLQQIQVKAKLVVPIVQQQTLWGLMIAHQCDQTRQWSDFEVSLLQQLADQVSIALAQAQLIDALRESEANHRVLLNAVPDFICRMNATGTYLDARSENSNAPLLLLDLSDQLIGKTVHEVLPLEIANQYLHYIQQAFQTGEIQIYEYPLFVRDQFYDCEARIAVNGVEEVLVIVRDVTERKQAETEIRKALEKEKELSELKSRFISMTSHEFRTPLSTILMATELLEYYSDRWTESEKTEQFQVIQVAVQRMTQLLEDVLLVGRLEAGKLQVKPTVLNLEAFCAELAREIQTGIGRNHHVNFVSHCTNTPADNTRAFSDENLLRQTLGNLLANAVKYSPPNTTIQLELWCEAGTAIFQVRDQGIGVPLEEQSKLFESFYRAANSGTSPGTGLGLAIAKQCLELINGEITFTSQLGQGSTFTVTMPRHINRPPAYIEFL